MDAGPPLTIYWVRHGYSCANYKKEHHHFTEGPFPHTRVADPYLHCDGIEQAKAVGKQLALLPVTFDLVCSSTLRRAMETGKLIYDELSTTNPKKVFDGNKYAVCELPFIGEISPIYQTADNKASKPEPDYVNTHYMFTYDRNETPSYEKFATTILPILYGGLIDAGSINEDGSFHIIIISHGHFLKSVFGEKLDNCEYIVETNAMKHAALRHDRMAYPFNETFSQASKWVVNNLPSEFVRHNINRATIVRNATDCDCFVERRVHSNDITDDYELLFKNKRKKSVRKSARKSKNKKSVRKSKNKKSARKKSVRKTKNNK